MDLQTQIPDRRPVWEALSALFLDNELDEGDLARLAEILTLSPYSLGELDAILYGEVLPVLWINGYATAGVWAGFDQDWLEEQIVRRSQRRLHWPSRLLPRGLVREPWAEVRRRIERARAAAP